MVDHITAARKYINVCKDARERLSQIQVQRMYYERDGRSEHVRLLEWETHDQIWKLHDAAVEYAEACRKAGDMSEWQNGVRDQRNYLVEIRATRETIQRRWPNCPQLAVSCMEAITG